MTRDRLTLMQWLSPGFPVSAFAYSHGLEWAIEAGEIGDPDTLGDWLETLLRQGSGLSDAVLLAAACRGEDPGTLSELAEALAASRERWQETRDQGAAFVETTNALVAPELPAMPYPVALGVRARALDLPTEEVVALYLQAFAANLISVAVRHVPLGQTAGQVVSQRLHPVISDVAARACAMHPDDIASGALRSDLASLRHETMDVRIFRT